MIKTILKHYFLDKTLSNIFDNLISTFTPKPVYVDGVTYTEVHVTDIYNKPLILFNATYNEHEYINDDLWLKTGYYDVFYFYSFQNHNEPITNRTNKVFYILEETYSKE
jgi:hypothetical protein